MAKADEPINDSTWQQRAVDRSLSGARERAVSRSGQILDAAWSLMEETGGIDFTVQDIVDRSGLSLRSFYKHFGGKDELLLALFEELLRSFADDLRREVEVHDDPVEQFRAYVTGFYGRAQTSGEHAGEALGTYHVRMLSVRKEAFTAALGPQIALLQEIIDAGAATGAFRRDIDPEVITGLLTVTLMSAAQMRVLDVRLTGTEIQLDDVWAWCSSAVVAPTEPAERAEPGKRAAPAAKGGRAATPRGTATSRAPKRSPRARSAG